MNEKENLLDTRGFWRGEEIIFQKISKRNS